MFVVSLFFFVHCIVLFIHFTCKQFNIHMIKVASMLCTSHLFVRNAKCDQVEYIPYNMRIICECIILSLYIYLYMCVWKFVAYLSYKWATMSGAVFLLYIIKRIINCKKRKKDVFSAAVSVLIRSI